MVIFITSIFIVLVFSVIFFLYSTYNQKKQPKTPPSPPKIPIIGNLHQLGSLPHLSLHALSQKYGPLMLLHMGPSPTLIVSSKDTAEEIMKTHDLIFSSRPSTYMAKKLMYGKDIAFSPYSEYWRQAKKICIIELLSSKKVESFRFVREEEVKNTLEKIASSSSSAAVNLSKLIVSLTNDIVCRVAFGRKYSEQGADGTTDKFNRMLGEFLVLLGTFYVGDFIPALGWISRLSGLDQRVERNSREFDGVLERIVKDHEHENRDIGNKSTRDFVDILLQVQKDNTLGVPFTKDHIKAIILDMFAAGTDTTYTSIEWAMAELLSHPEVMKKAQEEAREIAKGKSMITEDELHQMLYLKAIIKESLRLHPPVPLLVPRESTESINIYGYDIPAKTRVMINAWAIGRDPKSWEEPESFKPERFMSGGSESHVDFKGHDFELIPFGAGRRGCPGIPFATSTIELALANLLYKFDWKIPKGEDLNMDQGQGITAHKKTPLLLIANPYLA